MSDFSKREEEILKFWQERRVFEKSLAKPAPKGEFIFYDGPPFATGLPHYGHILPGTIKDVIPRYKTMRGYHVSRRWGWDCHGLPLENQIEQELGLKDKHAIETFGIERFNEAARAAVLRYAEDWKRIIPRTGRWVDMEHDYKTMDTSYIESVWWAFKTLYRRGLVYEGFKAMHLCPRCGTTLSNFEVAQGYKEIEDIAVTVKFPLASEKATLLVWTTTPWTLPGNAAVAINLHTRYIKARAGKELYIVAKSRASILPGEAEVVEEFLGEKLLGKRYTPPFDYFVSDRELKNRGNAWKVYAADFVTTEEGTGIVHIAPTFGADDLALAQKHGIPLIRHITEAGVFTPEVKDFAGLPVKPKDDPRATDKKIVSRLKRNNTLFKEESVTHAYPHCWRCDTPLLNWAADSWFINVQKIKRKLLLENAHVRWVPEHIGTGRFARMLEQAPDWAISRSRFWGAPLPVWKCGDCDALEVVGSVAEIVARSGKMPHNARGETDLHRPHIDEVVLSCTCGGSKARVPEVFDCWFESGAMPFASSHYPFNKKEFNPKRFFGFSPVGYPAHFISESIDQTRGWFYALIVLGVALFGKVPYRAVITNGTILAEDGRKMSKRLKNYPELAEVLDRYGADALRYYLLSSPAIRGEDVNFSLHGVEEVYKKVLGRLDNVRSFYELCTENQHTTLHINPALSAHVLDRWIRARLSELVREVTNGLESYELSRAVRPLAAFVEDLSTWYVRRSRERLRKKNEDGLRGLAVLQHTLATLAAVMAPPMPFFAEALYRRVGGQEESVHLCEWPIVAPATESDVRVLRDMENIRRLASLALQLREEAGIKIRQPLGVLKVRDSLVPEFRQILAEEINVKEIAEDPSLSEELWLDTTITPTLREEGILREWMRAIQEWRKEQGLSRADRPGLLITTDEDAALLRAHRAALMQQTNLLSLEIREVSAGDEPVPRFERL